MESVPTKSCMNHFITILLFLVFLPIALPLICIARYKGWTTSTIHIHIEWP